MDLENLDPRDRLERHHVSLSVAALAGVLAFVVVAVFFHTWGQNFMVTTPFDGGNLSTDVGTDVEMNFYVRNTGKKPLLVDKSSLELKFDQEWSFWSRNGFSSRETTSLSTGAEEGELKVQSGSYRKINAKFTTPLREGVFNLTLVGETNQGAFEKKVKVVVRNQTATR